MKTAETEKLNKRERRLLNYLSLRFGFAEWHDWPASIGDETAKALLKAGLVETDADIGSWRNLRITDRGREALERPHPVAKSSRKGSS